MNMAKCMLCLNSRNNYKDKLESNPLTFELLLQFRAMNELLFFVKGNMVTFGFN